MSYTTPAAGEGLQHNNNDNDNNNNNNNVNKSGGLLPPVRSQEEVQRRFLPLLCTTTVCDDDDDDDSKTTTKIFRKKVTSFLRRATKGECIITSINGIMESQKMVEDDTSWVVCGKAAGEFYVLTNDEFQDCYDESSKMEISDTTSSSSQEHHEKEEEAENPQRRQRLRQRGFYEYKSKRYVLGRVVTEDDMNFFRRGRDRSDEEDNNCAYFVAPWGETMRVEVGDYLVTQYIPPLIPNDDDNVNGDGNGDNNSRNQVKNEGVYRVEKMVFEYSYIDIMKEQKEQEENGGNEEKRQSGSGYWMWAGAAIGVAALTITGSSSRR